MSICAIIRYVGAKKAICFKKCLLLFECQSLPKLCLAEMILIRIIVNVFLKNPNRLRYVPCYLFRFSNAYLYNLLIKNFLYSSTFFLVDKTALIFSVCIL